MSGHTEPQPSERDFPSRGEVWAELANKEAEEVSAVGRAWARWPPELPPTEDSHVWGRGTCISTPSRICFLGCWLECDGHSGEAEARAGSGRPPSAAAQGLHPLLEGNTPTGQAVQVLSHLGQGRAQQGEAVSQGGLSLDPPMWCPLRIWLIFTAAPRDSTETRVQGGLSGGREWNLGLFYRMRGPGKDRWGVTGEGKR